MTAWSDDAGYCDGGVRLDDSPQRARLELITPASLGPRLGDLPATIPELELLVLFGSIVKGRSRTSSDVDLAVRCTGPADLDALYLVLAPRVGTDHLDLVDLRRAGPLLAFEVARSGRLLFERQAGDFREFQSLASRRYCDTAKLRAAQKRAIQAFLERSP